MRCGEKISWIESSCLLMLFLDKLDIFYGNKTISMVHFDDFNPILNLVWVKQDEFKNPSMAEPLRIIQLFDCSTWERTNTVLLNRKSYTPGVSH